VLVARAARRFGVGPTMIGGIALAGGANLLIPLAPLAGAGSAAAFALLALAAFANGFGQPFYNASQVSVRQAVTPDGFLGRVNATMQFLASSTAPLGALAGGAIGQTIGLWPALLVGALGTSAAAAWLVLSPARTLSAVEELAPAA
jgi:MFS family permease